MMSWKECRQFIRNAEVDEERIASITERSMQRKKIIDSLPASEENVSFIVEGYYEVIKELLVAYLLKNGLRSRNHQCLIAYFYAHHGECEFEANLISEMSYLRNRLDYYGESVPLLFYTKNEGHIREIIALLLGLVRQ